ncbi:cobalamin biosynthesis protein CobW [Achromobacter marplatensis]|jgi:G3E family GTPase|uniref:G3E family GTPase n=1 Tax=Achromobacter marplatensis TaxID=470868 RepID=A0ABX9GB53_9BURK|nr:CobW family GTP-binding protein [Achromobacter marplatensis]OWT68739.1 cobalamin biosynthesis protein CobW [Achromobacter marplatensis]RBP20803.1 G3E family GTPase [Achromobacter marplatensis]CAB3678819.1 P-loop guanosine triphosphatase YjiA [Achromobacter marplatensis]
MAVDLFLLCGFLGSGKTTLLVDYLRDPASRDTGVIVNEAGEVGVDGAIVANDSDNVPMTLMANGCVCCSLRSDLVYTLSALLDAPRPDGEGPLQRVILECSGLSRPGPIIASLADPELARRGLRLTVVCTDDCARDPDALAEMDEAMAQFGAAHRIVLTKTDLLPDGALDARAVRAAALNPLAAVIADPDRRRAVQAAFAPSQGVADLAGLAARMLTAGGQGVAHPRIRVMAARAHAGISWTDFSEWLDNLAGLCGERLLRVKAVVRVNECAEPILIQSVGTTFSAPQRLTRQPDAPDAIIVIARDIDAGEIRASAPHAPVDMLA